MLSPYYKISNRNKFAMNIKCILHDELFMHDLLHCVICFLSDKCSVHDNLINGLPMTKTLFMVNTLRMHDKCYVNNKCFLYEKHPSDEYSMMILNFLGMHRYRPCQHSMWEDVSGLLDNDGSVLQRCKENSKGDDHCRGWRWGTRER